MERRGAEGIERFETVYRAVRDPLGRYLARRAGPDDLDDLFAETMTVLWRRLDEVPPGEEIPWCYGVARRVLATHRRGNGRLARLVERIGFHSGLAEPAHVYGTNPELAAALARLSPLDAEIVRLWAWEGLAPREIAAIVERSPNAVSIRLSRARETLRVALAPTRRPGVGAIARKDPATAGHGSSVEQMEGTGDG